MLLSLAGGVALGGAPEALNALGDLLGGRFDHIGDQAGALGDP